MTSKTTQRFRAAFQDLPESVQRQAREAYRLFKNDPAHPSLHFKPVLKNPPTWSVRIGLHYRAVAVRSGDELVWFWIGSHADYDNLLKRR